MGDVPIMTIRLDPARRRDLGLLIEDTGGWSANHVVNRAIRDMLALHFVHQKQAAAMGGVHGKLLLRVVRDFGAGMLVNRDLSPNTADSGEPVIIATRRDSGMEELFWVDSLRRLLVRRSTPEGVVQTFRCNDGNLELLDAQLAEGAPILN
jgi:hypothetical protein